MKVDYRNVAGSGYAASNNHNKRSGEKTSDEPT